MDPPSIVPLPSSHRFVGFLPAAFPWFVHLPAGAGGGIVRIVNRPLTGVPGMILPGLIFPPGVSAAHPPFRPGFNALAIHGRQTGGGSRTDTGANTHDKPRC